MLGTHPSGYASQRVAALAHWEDVHGCMPKPEALLRHVPAVASFGSVMLGGWWMVA
jgi:hypothetical protein